MIYLGFLLSCSLSPNDSETVFLSLYQPVIDIAEPCIEQSTLEEPIEEILQLGSNWEGTLIATGIREDYDSSQNYSLTLSFQDVYVTTGDITLNGEALLDMKYSIDLTDSASTTQKMTLRENLKVSGDVSGTAKLNFTLIQSYNAQNGQYSTEVSGDISGTDVSSFLQGSLQ